jgi:hypothetical protein
MEENLVLELIIKKCFPKVKEFDFNLTEITNILDRNTEGAIDRLSLCNTYTHVNMYI